MTEQERQLQSTRKLDELLNSKCRLLIAANSFMRWLFTPLLFAARGHDGPDANAYTAFDLATIFAERRSDSGFGLLVSEPLGRSKDRC
jgi:hypothetical protein